MEGVQSVGKACVWCRDPKITVCLSCVRLAGLQSVNGGIYGVPCVVESGYICMVDVWLVRISCVRRRDPKTTAF